MGPAATLAHLARDTYLGFDKAITDNPNAYEYLRQQKKTVAHLHVTSRGEASCFKLKVLQATPVQSVRLEKIRVSS